jgi:tetratricopeptide (TPR) repeat protein
MATAIAIAAALVWAPAAPAAERREVRDPHFGEVLFHFFQENYFSALTQLMTAQHFARVTHHAEEAELLRGGMLLSYGLHQEAGRIFQALIDAGAAPAVRDRAWFYLAKIRHQRGYVAEAEDAIARITGPLPGELDDERRVLQAYLLLQRQHYAEAVAALKDVSLRSEWGVYGRYNLGVALVQAGERGAGMRLLEEIGRDADVRKRGEEFAALSDKANVALAYAQLQDGAPALARPLLERVRLNGLLSNKALLGMGWAHAALEQHERALVPWLELTERPAGDTAVQEALLAVPYAFGKLGAFRQSLERYEQALEAYTGELVRLDESIVAIRGGALVENILRSNPGEESGWFWRVRQVPDTPESRYLTELLASHAFQEGLKNYRDLRFLVRNLDDWARTTQVFDDMVATRRQAYAERLPRVLAGERALQFERARALHRRHQDELARIERDGDAAALANDKELDLLARLARTRDGVDRSGDPAMQEKHRLLSGLLAWDLAAQAPARLRAAQKNLTETARVLEEADGHRQALAQAQVEVPGSFAGYTARIEAERVRIGRLRGDIQRAAVDQEQHLATLAIDELTRRREQIASYIVQARFAVAQIHDQAVRAADKEKPQ